MKGKFRFSLLVGLLYDIGISFFMPKGEAVILSFSFEVKDSASGRWKSSNSITKGTNTRLNCITDSSSPTDRMWRMSDLEPLKPLIYSRYQIFHDFGRIDCDKMGTYVCGNGAGTSKNVDLGILKCEPQLCKRNSREQTITATENTSKSFSLCILAYPEISGVEMLTTSNKDNGKAVDIDWRIDTQTFATYLLNITLTNISQMDYGVHNFSIVVVYGTQMKRETLDYTVVLNYFSPPDCPTNVHVLSGGLYDVTLAWQPGSGKKTEQIFYVYSSTDNMMTWHQVGNTTNNSRTVTGLVESSYYTFRIVSANKFMENIHENLCNNKVYYKPEKLHVLTRTTIPSTSATTEAQDSNTFPSTAVWIAIVVVLLNIIIIAVIIGIVLHIKKGKLLRTTQNKRQEVYSPDSRYSDTTENTDSLMSEGSKGHIYSEVI